MHLLAESENFAAVLEVENPPGLVGQPCRVLYQSEADAVRSPVGGAPSWLKVAWPAQRSLNLSLAGRRGHRLGSLHGEKHDVYSP